ncbi:Ig domain-containing protein [Candidatus Thiomargarita nelsonii]|uniref:Ig domain-containing protein n=1 Tax=Candidatus Thiomargarita nelsonii TaxID=1003181 RepID=A0A176S5K3_9GAMM|nr:Ig domain-containing protein [Candidatus Thiomargarita nelsonii]
MNRFDTSPFSLFKRLRKVFLLFTLTLQGTVLLSCSQMYEEYQTTQLQLMTRQPQKTKLPLVVQKGLVVKYNQNGLASLTYNNHEYYGGEATFNHAIYADYQATDGSTFRIGGPYPQKKVGYGNDITRTYENGISIRTQYAVEKEDELQLTLTFSNPNDKPIVNLLIQQFKLLFPKRPSGGTTPWNWQRGYNIRGGVNDQEKPPIIGIETEKAVIVLTKQISQPEILQINPQLKQLKSGLTEAILMLGIHKEAPLLPGETRKMNYRIQFAPPGSDYLEVGSKIYKDWQIKHPKTFKWPDRRPIGTEFLCRSGQLYSWPHNPRGWFHDPDLYIINDAGQVTKAGQAEFKKRLFERAVRVIANLQELNAQALIIWDIEGQEAPHPISYVGDPRILGQIAPEMDAIADEYIQKFKKAGFKIGLTLGAPSYIVDKKKFYWNGNRKVKSDKETVAELADKIAYAKKRWGVKLFYIDAWALNANVSAVDIQALHEIHPDVLLIPEWEDYQWWAYSAGYRTRNLSESGTPPDVRAAFPDAFSVNQFHGTYEEQSIFYDWILEEVERGDIILFHSWYESSHKHGTKHLYDEVKYRKQRNPKYVDADLNTLLKLAESTKPAERYQAAEELGKKSGVREAVNMCLDMIEDKDWVVAKRAIDALGQLAAPITISYLKAKALEFTERNDFHYWYQNHAYVATQALGKMGAIPALQEIINTPDIQISRIQYAVEGLGKTGNRAAIPILVKLMNQPADSDTSDIKVYVAKALEKLPSDESAISALINALQIKLKLGEKYCKESCLQNKENAIKVETAKALAQQGKGNPKAINALIDAYQANERANRQELIAYALWKMTGKFKLNATASEWRQLVFQAPDVPSLTYSEGGNKEITFAWIATGDYYTVKYGTSSGNYTKTIDNVTSLPYTIKGLAPGTVYYVVVQAHDENGDSQPSEEEVVMTLLPGDNTPPLGAAFWYDADDSSSLTILKGKVIEWQDKSGNQNNLKQSVESLQPKIVKKALNGHAVIRFDRDWLSTPDHPSLNFSEATMYAVVKATAIKGWSAIFRKGLKSKNASKSPIT